VGESRRRHQPRRDLLFHDFIHNVVCDLHDRRRQQQQQFGAQRRGPQHRGDPMTFFADFADLPLPIQLFLAFVFAVDLISATAWAALITARLGGMAIRAVQRREAQRLWREFERARNATEHRV
jgi:hypothetical protein